MTHRLKTWDYLYKSIVDGSKTFEVRKNDRGYKVDDLLVLVEVDPVNFIESGNSVTKRVTFVLHGGQWGVEEGYVVMGLSGV